MKRIYSHGTSEDNLDSIRKNGFDRFADKIWNPSDDEIYFWSPDALVETGDCEESDKLECARQRAFQSAQMAMAVAKSGKCVVFEVELDDEDISPDFSCDNMGGAVCTREEIPPSAIKRIYISDDLSLVRGYFIHHGLQNDLFRADLFSEIQIKVAACFKGFYLELEDFELRELQ